jgi:molybdopterin molybdotransferase
MTHDIGFKQALELSRNAAAPLESETAPLSECVGRVCAEDVVAAIDYPSQDASLKDGYAVVSSDVAHAAGGSPVTLRLVGVLGAGDPCHLSMRAGNAVRVLSGAPIPHGADAVLAEEFAREEGGQIKVTAHAAPGRNILFKASEIRAGEILVNAGEVFTPSKVGLAVAGGVEKARVYRRPVTGLLAIGAEVLLPGHPPEQGKLFASNLALQDAWFKSRSMTTVVRGAGDSLESITSAINSMTPHCDILITSGGAWKGERDLAVKALDRLGWELIFHRVRLGPGKAVAMGRLGGKPVFCLPGGPPSNEAAFLLLAFPSALALAGRCGSPFPILRGTLEEDVGGQADWTQVVHCRAERVGGTFRLKPLELRQRLRPMTRADGLVLVPEGTELISRGAEVDFLCLNKEIVMGGLFS